MIRSFCSILVGGLVGLAIATGGAQAQAKLKSSEELFDSFVAATKGKRIAWVPQALGMPLTEGWTSVMKEEAAALGMELIVRDPNWSTSAMTQAVTALIAEKPDVLVVHNPNVQLLARQLKQAEEAGIHVVQLNMVSNYKTDAFVGGDWKSLARGMAEDIVKTCGEGSGKSGKVAVVQGELTSDVSILETEGAMEVFAKHPEIKVVSDQAAMWDPNKAREVTAAVLQQHPDLCAVLGHWGPMTMGAGQAVKAAGLSDKVTVYSTGENPQMICDAIKDGVLTKYWSVDNKKQGRDAMLTIKYLLMMAQPPGTYKLAAYSPFEVITRDNADSLCWR
ncbi:MAG: sugar ABC transporter substrate-binding protein [Mesorhizobium sp.]|nr:sugar ABC transporter substrate-binding protein [Mesorhizobium sp.]MCO5162246.1 sugar ABC transporter substrate-binding protein [Mesorhizobium sp.]